MRHVAAEHRLPQPRSSRPAIHSPRSARALSCCTKPPPDIGRPYIGCWQHTSEEGKNERQSRSDRAVDCRRPAAAADWRTTWTPSRRHFLTVTGLALGGAALGLGVSACGTAQTGTSAGQAGKGRAGAAGETLFVAGFQWGPPKSFNPLAASPDLPTNFKHRQLIYESLLRFNLLDGSLAPGPGQGASSSPTTRPCGCRCRTAPSGPTAPT